MSKRQLTPRAKLKRDLEELIALRKWPLGSPERDAALARWVMRKSELSARDIERRNEAWLAAGSPDLASPEWQAELARLRRPVRRKASAPPPNTSPDDAGSLFWQLMLDAGQLAAGQPVRMRDVPGQFLERQTKEQRAGAARMYRWLWRHFPGLLKACDPEMRRLIREAGGIA